MKPNITQNNAQTGETIEREMTDEEYEALLASGWTVEGTPQTEGDSEE